MNDELTHLDEEGNARMVDIGGKQPTHRVAVAEALVVMSPATAEAFFGGTLPKGDALATARVAGIMGAKRTPDLIPLCHPIELTAVSVHLETADVGARIVATTETLGKTGVEMEAMTAVAVAALTVYDMVKGIERGVHIQNVRLLSKRGGKSGEWIR